MPEGQVDRTPLKKSIEKALRHIAELEATISDFNGDQGLLEQRIKAYLEELQTIHALRDLVDVEVPVDLIRYLDEGGNPDTYTAQAFKQSLQSNQLSKGKVDAIKSFRDEILEQASKLQSGDQQLQATALLQLLGLAAERRDIGGFADLTCQHIVANPQAAAASKRLAYELVQVASLQAGLWDLVCRGIKSDISAAFNSDVQCAALETLPQVPGPQLRPLLAEGDFARALIPCLRSSSADVRATAMASVAQCLADPHLLSGIASSEAAFTTAPIWAVAFGDALLDPIPLACTAAHAAIAQLLKGNGTPKPGPSWQLRAAVCQTLCQHVLNAFPAVLRRASRLAFADQVHVAAGLVGVLQYAASCGFRYPEAVARAGTPKTPKSAAQDALFGSVLAASTGSGTGSSADLGTGPAQAASMVEQAGEYLLELLDSVNAAVVFEAARGLLSLVALRAAQSTWSSELASVASGSASSWGPAAVAALCELWDRQPQGLGHAQIIAVLAPCLKHLAVSAQLALIRQLFPMIASLPMAGDRTAALALTWRAVLELDLQTRRAVRCNDRAVAGAELKATLSDPFVKEAITSTSTGTSTTGMQSPAFREELVCTLLASVRAHPRAQSHSFPGASPLLQANGAVGQPEDLARMTHLAAHGQRVAELADWHGSAKIALQGSKACLGWEREPAQGTYACTIVVDMWLQLLQHALHASHVLPAVPAPLDPRLSASFGILAGMESQVAASVAEHNAALQNLLGQMLTHWRVLSAAVKPRVLWVACHHLHFPGRLNHVWVNLLNAMSSQLEGKERELEFRRVRASKAAASDGSLVPRGTSGAAEGGYITVDEAEIRAEGVESALIAVQRIVNLLAFNAMKGITPALQEIARNTVTVIQPYAKSTKAGQGSRESCLRILQQLVPIATAVLPDPPQGDGPQANGNEGPHQDSTGQLRFGSGPKQPDSPMPLSSQFSGLPGSGPLALPPPPVPAPPVPMPTPPAPSPAIPASNGNVQLPAPRGLGLDLADLIGEPSPSSNGGPVTEAPLAPQATSNGGPPPAATPAVPPPPPPEPDLDEGPYRASREGYPMAAPTTATLQATRRATRYLKLEQQLAAGVAAAASLFDALPGIVQESHEAEVMPSLPEAMAIVAGAEEDKEGVGLGSGASTELTGVADPLRLMARHELDPTADTLSIQLHIYNRLSVGIKGFTIRLALGGPLTSEGKAAPLVRVPVLAAGDTTTWQAAFRICGFGRLTIQPYISLPAQAAMLPGDDPSLRCLPYSVSPVLLLRRPTHPPSGEAFFQQWSSMPASTEVEGVCRAPGVQGGLAMLSRLQEGPLSRVLLTGIPAQGGFNAVYLGHTPQGDPLAMVMSGRLLPSDTRAQSGLGALATDPLANQQSSPGRVAVRMSIRSTSGDVIAAINADRSAWIEELGGGALSEGASAESLGHTGLPSIHPAVAHLKGLYVLPKMPTGDNAAFELLGGLSSTDTQAAITQEWYRIRAAATSSK
ncbi:hypothetical protein WJX74_008085 [Apatococcus lobatus]|uniref:Mediator complex subunit 10 n=1 Tax=Apatococcus lobatus TaxID=904363 RepID=A0AAW1SGB4_9CHLO